MFNVKNKICKVSLISAGSLINKCNAAEAICILDTNSGNNCKINNINLEGLKDINLLDYKDFNKFIENINLKIEKEITNSKDEQKVFEKYFSDQFIWYVPEASTNQEGGYSVNTKVAMGILNAITSVYNGKYSSMYFDYDEGTKDKKQHNYLLIEYGTKRIFDFEGTKPQNERRKIDKKYVNAYEKVYKDISSKNQNYTYNDIIQGLLAVKDEKDNPLFFKGTEFAFYKEVPGITNGKIDNKYNIVKDNELNEAVSSYLGCVLLNYPVYCEKGYKFSEPEPEKGKESEEPGKPGEKPEPGKPGTPGKTGEEKPKEKPVKPKEQDLKPLDIPKEKQIDKIPEKILPSGNSNPGDSNPTDPNNKDNNKDNKGNNGNGQPQNDKKNTGFCTKISGNGDK